MSETPEESEILEKLESDLATTELTAHLMEWMGSHIHRVSALSNILGWYRKSMKEQNISDSCIDNTIPMILDRVWPTYNNGEDDDEGLYAHIGDD